MRRQRRVQRLASQAIQPQLQGQLVGTGLPLQAELAVGQQSLQAGQVQRIALDAELAPGQRQRQPFGRQRAGLVVDHADTALDGVGVLRRQLQRQRQAGLRPVRLQRLRVDAAHAQVQLAQAAQRCHVEWRQLALQRQQQAFGADVATQLRKQQAAAVGQLATGGQAIDIALEPAAAVQGKRRGIAQRDLALQTAPRRVQLHQLQLVAAAVVAVAGLQRPQLQLAVR